jgi:hypothetical protein
MRVIASASPQFLPDRRYRWEETFRERLHRGPRASRGRFVALGMWTDGHPVVTEAGGPDRGPRGVRLDDGQERHSRCRVWLDSCWPRGRAVKLNAEIDNVRN